MDGFKPKHKVKIEPVAGCKCLIVDEIMVPWCDCTRHTRAREI